MSDFQSELRRSHRLLTLFTILPLLIVAGIFVGGYVPATWRNLYYLALLLAVLGVVFAIPIRERFRLERRSGLVPKRPGFSGKLELVAEKLREYAARLEEEGPEDAWYAHGLDAYITEVRRVALAQDRRELLRGLQLDIREDAPPRNVQAHVARLRKAAGEVEMYAQEVRLKGGIFRLDWTQRVMGMVMVGAAVWYGVRLMMRTWSEPGWSFIGGALLVLAAGVVAFGLVMSQRDAA